MASAFTLFPPVKRYGALNFSGNCTSLKNKNLALNTKGGQVRERERVGKGVSREVIRSNSLEDSKRQAKSKYDNISDVNQQYISELSWVERKYGPKIIKNDISREAQRSILRGDRNSKPAVVEKRPGKENSAEKEGGVQVDLNSYSTLRNRLFADTLLVGGLGICAMWGVAGIKEVQSFAVGFSGSMAYVILLMRSVDKLGESARNTGNGAPDSLQPARIAILLILVLASAKNSQYLSVVPVLLGLFAYKLALLLPLATGEAFE